MERQFGTGQEQGEGAVNGGKQVGAGAGLQAGDHAQAVPDAGLDQGLGAFEWVLACWRVRPRRLSAPDKASVIKGFVA